MILFTCFSQVFVSVNGSLFVSLHCSHIHVFEIMHLFAPGLLLFCLHTGIHGLTDAGLNVKMHTLFMC